MKEFRNIKKQQQEKSYDEPEVECQLSYNVDYLDQINDYELYELKEEVLKRLQKNERELLYLLYEQKLPVHTVAQRLGITDSAVYKRRTQLVNKIKIIANILMN